MALHCEMELGEVGEDPFGPFRGELVDCWGIIPLEGPKKREVKLQLHVSYSIYGEDEQFFTIFRIGR